MPRTRSAHQQPPSTSILPDTDTPPSPPPPSFGNKLSRFQYESSSTSTTTITSPASAPARAARPHSTSARSPAKRARPKTTTTIPTPQKRRKSSKYAPPTQYAHLPPLPDILAPNLICVFIGTNPGIRTASTGHAYAHPSNLFWKLLHTSGLTDRRLSPNEDATLPARYCMGNTNIVARASRDAGELSREEMCEGAQVLEEKIREYRPEAVCVVGKGIWEAVWRAWFGKGFGKGEFAYGWQDERFNMGRMEGFEGARVFVATSTSGLAAGLSPREKEEIWKPFGEWVQKRRTERGFVPAKMDEVEHTSKG